MEACPAAETLAELVEARLAPEAAAALHRHVRGCTSCRMVLAGLADSAGGESALTAAARPDPGEAGKSVRYEPGARLGRFEIQELLGLGGMGAVYAARDPELGRQVALKVLRVGGRSDSDANARRARLLREAQAMAQLAHPNVVTVFEVGQFEDRLFVVMEKVEGKNLKEWLRERPHPLPEILEVFTSAGRGLAAAHAAGLVHRDFKPDNVLVGDDGRVRVTDFGLARHLDGERALPSQPTPDLTSPSPADTLTPLGALLGTPAYMAPEQMMGEVVDARADLFAFCTSLWEAVHGKRPFASATLVELKRRIDAGQVEPAPQRSVPAWLRRELLRGLSAAPSERHASMAELLAALARGGGEPASPRRRLLALGAAVAIAGTLAAGAVVLGRATRSTASRRRTVAVVGPKNLGGALAKEWLSPALAEMLGTEVGTDASLRPLPAQNVALALADLGPDAPAALDKTGLAKLGQSLGADVVITGGYSVSVELPPQLKLELRLWDATTGEALAQVAEAGDEERLFELVARAGAQVRRSLGGDPLTLSAAAQASFPAHPEAAQLYALGRSQLRAFEAASARDSLSRAAELAPGNPRVLTALADAHDALGYVALARETAHKAFDASKGLPREERLRVELAYRHANQEDARAIELARALYTFFPDDIDSGLRLAEEQAAAGQTKESLETLKALRKLPPPAGNDARLDLAESQSAQRLGDFQAARAAAARAGQLAQARGSRWLLARARYAEAEASRLAGDPARATPLYEEARKRFAETGDRSGVARVETMAATVLADAGDLVEAQARFEQALQTFSQQGNRRGAGAIEHNLSIVLRRLRELPPALLHSARAQALYRETGDKSGLASALALSAHVKQDQGDLPAAAADLGLAIELRRGLKHRLLAGALSQLAELRLRQGNLPRARALLKEAQGVVKANDKPQLANLDAGMARLALAERRTPESLDAMHRAADKLLAANLRDEAALVEGALAAALLAEGKPSQAQAEVERGRAAIGESASSVAWPGLALAAARVQARLRPAERSQARASVDGVLTQALRTGVVEDVLQARLALAELGSGAEASAQLRLVLLQARERGFTELARAAESASVTIAAQTAK